MASCSTIEEAKLPGGYLVTPRVPQGLAAAVEGLTREVIRHSPKDIYVFAAHHFEKLLHVRERCEVSSVEKSCPVSRREEGTRALREMSRALRTRELDRAIARTTSNPLDQVGWSLCQTAKVLKRHRSIFGEESRRATTEQVFRMASENETDRSETRAKRSTRQKVGSSRRDELWRTTTSSGTERTCSNADSIEETGDSSGDRGRSGPRIMTPIASLPSGNVMLAKDIKTELRKNRLSSRERRTERASRHEEKTHRGEKAESRVPKSSHVKDGGSSSKKSCPDRQKKVEVNIEESKGRCRKNDESTSSRKQRGKSREAPVGPRANNENPRTPGMDRVKDYVVGRFATTKSLEELQTLNYVEKVQEIIDETSPIIKEKIEQLKIGLMGGPEALSWSAKTRDRLAGRGDSQEASPSLNSTGDALESRLTETRDLMASVSSSFSRPTRRSRSARSFRRSENTRDDISVPEEWRDGAFDNRDDQLKARLSRTRDLLENVSSSLSRPVRRSSSAKNSQRKRHETTDDENASKDALLKRLDETRNLLRGVSASFAKTGEIVTRHGAPTCDAEESSNSDDPTKTSLPAVRSNPTRNSSGDASRSDPDNLVLPAISPEAPRSSKVREDLILPVLSPSAGALATEEFADSSNILETNDDAMLETYGVSVTPDENNMAEVPMENVSRDSLNVTPDFDSTPQRPDSLEPVETSEAKIAEVACLEENVSGCPPAAEPYDLEACTTKVDVLEPLSGADVKPSPPDDLETRLREIRKVESAVAVALETKVKSESRESASLVVEDRRQYLEEERIVDAIFDADNDDDDEAVNDSTLGSGKKMTDEARESRPSEANEARGNGQPPIEDRAFDNLRHTSPEPLCYTYVLTEGSPYDIPDTVTTVVIPEGSVESPLSDRLLVELEEDEEIRVSLIPGAEEREELIEEVADGCVQSEVEAKMDSGDSRSSRDDLRRGSTTKRDDEEDTSRKSLADHFGELIEPETTAESTSADVDFIREIEEMQIPRQDLGSINEEASEELEDLDGSPAASGRMESPEVEEDEQSNSKTIGDVEKEARGDNEVKNVSARVEESMVVESDLSPEGTRPDDVYSESSNEAKESSVIDEAPVSAKCENFIADEEEISSATRTAESSNEVKETTLTDGLSLSVDPTRPFVPELNLDSLQDITVSSFKITEDDYDNQERGGSENTNSITDTLTSDENNRASNNGHFVQPSATEAATSPSRFNELDKATGHEAKESAERVEENIVKSPVEAKEDICEKTSAYVTGPSREEDGTEQDAEMGGEAEAEEKPVDPASPDAAMTKEEEEEKTAVSAVEDSGVHRDVETLQARREEEDAAIEENDDIEITNEHDDDDKGEIAETEGQAIASEEDNLEAENTETTNGNKNVHQADKSSSLGEAEDITATEHFNENDNADNVKFDEKEDIPDKSVEEEITRTEATNGNENVHEADKSASLGEAKDTATEHSNENDNADIVKFDEKEDIPDKSVEEEITRTEVTNEEENVEPEKEEEVTSRSEIEEMGAMEDSREMDSVDIEATTKDEKPLPKSIEGEISEAVERRISDEGSDAKDADIEKPEECEALEAMVDERPRSLEDENRELEIAGSEEKDGASSEGDVIDVQSIENEDGGKAEVTVEHLRESDVLDERVSKNPEPGVKRDSVASEKAEDEFDEEMSTRELETDDVLEDSYVEDETPLAFSRSASQCTTRRVSSGNLAKLREDPSLSWHEETEREDSDDGMSGNDPDSARVKFLGFDENETLGKSGSDDIGRNSSNSPRDTGNDTNETLTSKDSSKEHHIYVPGVDSNADDSTTETSSTLDSAVTKIQAGVRGFLARRRLQRGQQNRSSTLSSIPSIQDSEAIEPQRTDDRDREASDEKAPTNNDIACDLTKIQSNYRGYEARKRLRREDAVQRTTFSLDKSFAANGLQHTGEFHDCIALPIHDIAISREASKVRKSAVDDIEVTGKNFDYENGDVGELGSEENVGSTEVEDDEPTSSDREETAPKTSSPLDPGRLFFGTSGPPFVQFDTRPSVGQLVDLVLAKNDVALQTEYLNFITSVEDTEALIGPPEVPLDTKKCQAVEPNSSESLMEPLALSDSPTGVIIEEITSSDAENLTKPDEDQDRTMASANSSSAPEVIEDPPEPVSPLMEHHRGNGNTANGSRIEDEESGSYRATGGGDKRSKELDTSSENVTFALERRDSVNPEKPDDDTGPETDLMMNYIMLSESASATQEKHLLGPESSVDSMECPEVPAEEKNTSAISDLPVATFSPTKNLTEEMTQRISSSEEDSADHSEITMEDKKVTAASNADVASPKSPLAMKVEDLLDLGSEGTAGAHDKKPVAEVTLKPGDMTKSMSLSQDSQLADERIESPVTMVQIAPERSESLKQHNHSDSATTTPKSDEK